MTSLSMKTYPALFCGIFLLLFLGVRSEINATIASVPSAQTPTEVTSPHAASRLSSTDKTRNTSEKPFTHKVTVAGTERPTHNETPSVTTAETKAQEEKSPALPQSESSTSPVKTTTLTGARKAPALTTGPQPTSNNSTMTTMLPKTDPQKAANTTAISKAPKTTSFMPVTNYSSVITTMSTVLPQNSSEGLATTTSPKETTASVTATKHIQNITNEAFNESKATTEDPASSVNVTTGSVRENTKNLSATTESPIDNPSTTGARIRTSAFPTTAEVLSTNASISVATNGTQGGKILSTSTANPTKVTERVQTTEAQPCSSIGVVRQCLIVIASLAVVATVFIVTTIVLCTKLSSRKYKLKRQQQGTEMMCISSLLPERSNHQRIRYTRQRSPVPNGVRVIPNCDDSDDDTIDNLTLSSFLPDNDRYV